MDVFVQEKESEDQFCNAATIKKLNNTKQYTVMATGLMRSIITDANLTASAVKVWEYLYTKAIVNNKLCVKIRNKDLAIAFNCTERTIKRCVDNLKKNGYLSIESNFYCHGQRANTFYIKFPTKITNALQNTKDRKKPSKSPHRALDEPTTLEESIVSKEVPSCELSTTFPASTNETVNALPVPTSSATMVDQVEPFKLNDKIVTPDSDINVTPKNNIKKEILINNNIVVDVSFENTKRKKLSKERATKKQPKQKSPTKTVDDVLRETSLTASDIQRDKNEEEEIKKIEIKVNELYIKMASVDKNEKIIVYEEIRKLREIASTKTVEMNQRQHAAKLLSESNGATNSISKINPTVDFSRIPTDRIFSSKDFKRIEVGVTTFTSNKNDLRRICNEIIYAIKFGSLRFSQTGELLSISHAISIALKLLREKRWETPAPLQTKTAPIFTHKNYTVHRQREPQIGNHHIGKLLQTIGMT